MGEDDRKYTGGQVIAIWHRAVVRAADALLQLPPDQLAGLKVRSGEHLAAILTTAFLGDTPLAIDTHGDVDLRFRLSDANPFTLLPAGTNEVAFEIKSMPGPYREFDHAIDVARTTSDAIGSSLTVMVESANDILADARPLLERAQRSLLRKTSQHVSRNIFLVVHPLDRFALETYESLFIGAALAPLDLSVDTVWVLWVPDHLTVWSRTDDSWTDLMFTAINPDEEVPTAPDSLSILQDAETHLLGEAGHRTGSPYLFRLSAEPVGE
ncbi:hypothetical protein AB0J72_45180 [Dactylosporangium sp. NPDC049742]|uniref:hypothetical protein n=1 Tax=Dactylosporangium sp. NPDC049742 TaxID=3154737 RepID=UPI00341ADA46